MRKVLVLKLGALGDFVHAFHAFAAIRQHHADDHVTLLTTQPFATLARSSPWFDDVRVDARAPWWHLPAVWSTIRTIRQADFVYDLQTSSRSNRYFHLAGRPPWSGIAPGCSHPHANPGRDFIHTVERQREQLQAAGISHFPVPDRDWLVAQGGLHGITPPYALLMPGGAGLGSVKRWPVAAFAALATHLASRGLTPVVTGGAAERDLALTIRRACPAAVDLTGRTSIGDIAALAAQAALVVGNDTGPAHLAASVGTPAIMLFSAAGVPAQAAARGPAGEWATVLQAPDLDDLPAAAVVAAVEARLATAQAATPRAATAQAATPRAATAPAATA